MNIIKPWDPTPEIIFKKKQKTREPKNLISVCITNYNYADFIGDCLDTILQQTHDNIEIVIIDDCSNDHSLEVICEWLTAYQSQFYSLLLIQNKRNQGLAFSRNMAIYYAISNFIFILDSDNQLYPPTLEKTLTMLTAGNLPAVYTQIEEFGDRQGIGNADIWDIQKMKKNNYIDAMSLIRKDVWQSVGGFSHIENGWEDYDFWLKFIEHGFAPGYLPQILCRYRVHSSSFTATKSLPAHYDLELIMTFRHDLDDVII